MMDAARSKPKVVFDINVYLDYAGSSSGSMLLPTSRDMPTDVPAADALSLAFDERFALFASPHIFRNINRVLTDRGQSDGARRRFIEFIADLCADSGGAIVDPVVRDYAIGDHEDNHILALAKDPSVDADVIVSSDHHLIDLGPAWNGRLMMRPRQFVSQLMRSAAPHAVAPTPARTQPPTSLQPQPNRAAAESQSKRTPTPFPELRDVQLDRYGLTESAAPRLVDEPERG
ncbi:putative toxin-antitoxin system toxin component, PIN family [Microbacterium sp.]|uniref:PIN domain-containing protein n=1 Tax=Microbacterium sp. TaxID=51671 RepID=UPI002736C18A|nr:PIN domain-containing protein [Microbacterium sp.]MDP3949522.1 PIN domain-containing protein [Microbacterium sp.]